jgi:replicative DNA helicase
MFHRVIFSTIEYLYKKDAKKIDIIDIDGFLSKYNSQYKIFEANKGIEWLNEAIDIANVETFHYNCNRIKKFTLLRKLRDEGFNIKELYDEENEVKIKQFDSLKPEEIIEHYNKKINKIESSIIHVKDGNHISDGVDDLLIELQTRPVMGLSVGINALNYYLYGARKKYYLFSAASGFGKTRLLTYIGLQTGYEQNIPTLFISTELPVDEIQTMILAYIANVEERKILLNSLTYEEKERVNEAKEKLKKSNIYIIYLPDFDLQIIEHTIKKYILRNKIQFVCFDYIKESISSIEGLNKRIGQVEGWKGLMLTSERLKMLVEKYGVGIYSATQLNAKSFSKDVQSNQSLIAGATGIANSIDVGAIIRSVSEKEREKYELDFSPTKEENTHLVALDIYKNRRGLSDFTVYMRSNLGKLYYEEVAVVKGGNIIKVPKVNFEGAK